MRIPKATAVSLTIAVLAILPAAGAAPDDAAIVHALGRVGFGPRPGDVARIRQIGLDKYIEQQLEPSRFDDGAVHTRLAAFETLTLRSSEIASRFYTPPRAQNRQQQNQQQRPQQNRQQQNLPILELSQQKLLRAIYSERQLEEVLVDFWFNHFNVFAGKGQFARFYLTEYEREAIRPHVLGRFRDMLGATAKSPAMLWYLDNWMSGAGRTRGLNENYGRELLELHTLGVDGGYTQQDVVEVARAFTGWTIDAPRRGGGDFVFNPRIHDNGEKIVLGHELPANGGQKDGERVLDILAAHPSTAKHIARKLATRFIADNPPQAVVDRAATAFRESGGDLKKVTRAIVTSPEFRAAGARGGKVKTPFEFVVSAIRATGAEVRNAAPLAQQLRTLGMPMYGAQPPTGYDDTAASWVNSGALLSRMNFAVALVSNRVPGTRVTAASVDPDAIVPQSTLSASTRATVAQAGDKAQQLALLIGSPEFQKR